MQIQWEVSEMNGSRRLLDILHGKINEKKNSYNRSTIAELPYTIF